MTNIYELPLGLLYAMYSLTLAVSKRTGYRSFHNHDDHKEFYEEAVRHLPAALASSTPFDVLYVSLLSFLEVWNGNMSASSCYMALAARMAQTIGIDKTVDGGISWVSRTGKVLGSDIYTGTGLYRSLYLMLYIQDFYISHAAKIPCVLHKEIDSSFIQPGCYPDEIISYRLFVLPLLNISRKLKVEREKSGANIKDEVIHALVSDAVYWYNHLSRVMPESLNPDSLITKEWITYMKMLYYGLQLELNAPAFLRAFQTSNISDPVIKKQFQYQKELLEIVQNNLPNFSALLDIPFHFLHSVFLSAIYESLYSKINGLPIDISNQIQIFESVQFCFPPVAKQTEKLRQLSYNADLGVLYLQNICK